jgi:hypothetical protein
MDYFVYLVDRTGHIFARREIDCETVEEATAFARTWRCRRMANSKSGSLLRT